MVNDILRVDIDAVLFGIGAALSDVVLSRPGRLAGV